MMQPKEIVCAHSPDSDDAYMFYALATKKIRSQSVVFRHVLEDIESLNRKAQESCYGLTAISYHAWPFVADRYVLMASGSSVGDGYGPMLVASRPFTPAEMKGRKIAVPGTLTTAYLALKILEPDFEAMVVPFDKILDAVAERSADLGLVIHEGQLTCTKCSISARGGRHSTVCRCRSERTRSCARSPPKPRPNAAV
jgi:1,4-dihydroxy-6-naphthoate synthase